MPTFFFFFFLPPWGCLDDNEPPSTFHTVQPFTQLDADARPPRQPSHPIPSRRSAPLRSRRYNRTSLANQTNEIWTDLIGIQQSKDAGTNSAIEASLSAPGKIGGAGVGVGKKVQRGIAGDEAIIHPTEALVALARLHGAGAPDTVVEGDRGVCRVCGGMGHLTSMCKNRYKLLTDDGDNLGAGDEDEDSDFDSDSSSSSQDRKKKKKKKKKKKSSKGKSKGKKKKKRKHASSDSDSDDSDSDAPPKKKKRGKKSKKSRDSVKEKSKKKKASSSSSSASDSDDSSDDS